MHSIATITTPPTVTRLTTVERFKQELGIVDSSNDALIGAKIDEATSDIESHLSRTLSRATFTETFWPESCERLCLDRLILARSPVASISSIAIDGASSAADDWRLDADAGLLYRLSGGRTGRWEFGTSVVVVYAAGYLLPGESGRNLPPALESATLDLVSSYWASRGQDRTIMEEDVPGLGSIRRWVGAVGEVGDLPPDVMSKITPFRRIIIA